MSISLFISYAAPTRQSISRFDAAVKSGVGGVDASSGPTRLTLDGEEGETHISEQVIKKSRFIGLARHCESWDEARHFVEDVRHEHPKSRHVCFGFVSSSNNVQQERCGDDGEPTGTAGLPILGAIKGEGLSDTVCAVVRYYGGIKLGAGGLIRAYSGTARLVLREAPTRVLIPNSTFRLSLPSAANVGHVYNTVNKFGGNIGSEKYNLSGEVEVTVTCESAVLRTLMISLRDCVRGEVVFLDNEE